MKTLRRTFLLSVSAAALAFTGGLAGCSKQQASAPVQLGLVGPAPAWALKDVEGKLISSEQFKGKVVVVDFWATWCGPCLQEIPGYIALQKKYGDKLAIVGVSMDSDGATKATDTVKAYMAKAGVNYQIVMGTDEVVAAFGGMSAIPTTFLIDRNGQIRDRKEGSMHTADYEKRIVAALN